MRIFVKHMKNTGAELHIHKHVINNVQTLSKSCPKPNKTVKPTVGHLIWVSDIFHNKSWQNSVPHWPHICPTSLHPRGQTAFHALHIGDLWRGLAKGLAGIFTPDWSYQIAKFAKCGEDLLWVCLRKIHTLGYILSAHYFAKHSICTVKKHSKCKILKTIG